MFPARLYMGMVFFVLLGWMLGGIAEGQTQIITQTQSNDIMGTVGYTQTTAVSSNTGNPLVFFDSAWDFIDKVILFDWTVFYDVDPITGTQTPNLWMFIRIMLICVLGSTLLITILLTLRSVTLG